MSDLSATTIRDFEEQWRHHRDNPAYYGSGELFEDLIHPFLMPADFRGARVADIGSGSGRIVRMLAQAGAARILALEPADLCTVLACNTAEFSDRIEYLRLRGDELPPSGDLDFVVSFGVLHHIPDPGPVIAAAYRALRPGGRILVWLYGREGNGLYLSLALPLRRLTRHLPHPALSALCSALLPPLRGYAALCRHLPLPMRNYMNRHLSRLTPEVQRLTIYDQLNPAWAKYYRRDEAEALLRDGGFTSVRSFHRHGYSWTVTGTRPPRE